RGAGHTLAVQGDLSILEDGRRLLDCTLETFGRVDIWVNNAGVAPEVRRDLLETTPESFDRVLGINLRGPFFLAQMVARTMIDLNDQGKLKDPQIHFISSLSSTLASMNRGEYCVSKAGLSIVAQLFAVRLAEHGIRVYDIRPGIIETDMTAAVHASYDQRLREGLAPIRRWGTPTDVGKAVASLAAGSLPYSTGEVLHVDGGLHLPRL
ncbi:MAG TPA: 3-ketoacyl-ACP reductase, partial [Isosphaeraceae bacterium]|nr:3-ketoacyl-ACP reductase [Isosphaeraceae bacterium]